VKIKLLEVPEGAVIIVRDRANEMPDEEFRSLVEELHERFPSSLVVWTAEMEFKTMSEDQLEELLSGLLEHRRAKK
jgi:hypothetical protein